MLKTSDFIVLLMIVVLFLPFIIFETCFEFFERATVNYPLITSFLKFAVLATLGEAIGLRIRTGYYNQKGFGILPRAVVWGFLGMSIYLAFVVFSKGVPAFLDTLHQGWGSFNKILTAFAISATMNIIFAPIMMTFHKVTDTHIINNNGLLSALVKPIPFGDILKGLDWETHWHFVLKKTIPLFWIPAHTITFLLPTQFRVLFAAILGIVLGVILAFANKKPNQVTG